MTTTFTIDWLSYTCPKAIRNGPSGPYALDLRSVARVENEEHWKSEKPRFGYSGAFSPSSCRGPVVFCWPQGEQSHTHVQYSGSALAWVSDPQRLLHEVIGINAKVTRLDLAVDIMAGTPYDLWAYRNDDVILTRLRKRALITDGIGATVYFGSRSSDRFVRVYDKAAQLGLPGPWTRVELEIKGDAADGAARYILQEGLDVIPSMIKHVIDCPTLPWWREAFEGHSPKWGVPKAQARPDRAAWITKQVVPALIDLIRSDPHEGIATYRSLMRRVGEATGIWGVEFDWDTVARYDEGDA